MFSLAFLLLICGTLCNNAQKREFLRKEFLPQEETPVVPEADDETLAYLNHGYYKVKYEQIDDWYPMDISLKYPQKANLSKMSSLDDPPPFEMVSFRSHGWNFPFYGHAHALIYIDSNGFLSMVPRYCPHYGFCNWQEPEGHHDSQYQRYIAPMMTDFNPSRFITNMSNITYAFSGKGTQEKKLTVQWSNIVLFSFHNKTFTAEKDGFIFQAVLKEKGDMEFNYRKLPYYPGNKTLRSSSQRAPKTYPIVVGIEDAVIVKRNDKHVLADYNPLNLDIEKLYDMLEDSEEGVSVSFEALATCPEFKTCRACADYILTGTTLKCGWCEDNKICADIMGRESSSLSAGCLASNAMMTTHAQCDNIGKVLAIDDAYLTPVIIVVVVVVLIAVFLVFWVCILKKANHKLKYSKGIPQNSEAADKTTAVPGLKNCGTPADNKVEMSA